MPSNGTGKIVSVSDEYSIPVFTTNQTEFTDEDLLSAVYSNYSHPENFFYVNLNINQSTSYLQTYDLNYTNFEKRSEICANNNSEAISLFEDLYHQSPLQSELLEDEKYYQTKNSRIHNCLYFNPNGSLFDNFEEIGVFVKRPITTQNFKEFSEYLWSIYLTKFGSLTPLSSISNKSPDVFIQSIYSVRHVVGDYSLYDRIILKIFKFVIQLNSGHTTQIEEEIRTINGIYHPGPHDYKTTHFSTFPLIFAILLSIFSRKFQKKQLK